MFCKLFQLIYVRIEKTNLMHNTEPDHQLMADFIRFLRRTNEIKSEFIASKLGISQSQYSKLENGKLSNIAEMIPKIILFYKMNESVFWESYETFKINHIKPSGKAKSLENQFMEKLVELEQKNLKMIKELMLFVQRRLGE